ncbi:MAG TPA: alpha/beta hydrolase [Longimicrobium sp.]|nr:alpha/beta hydrolase [Longimicrobium sp.]
MRSSSWPFNLRFLPITLALCAAGGSAAAQADHAVRMVAVAPDVRLEVLDWGGRGEPLVFLAGLGNTAHVFDTFAPRFTDRHRVIGITRRGFGASTRPAAGYAGRTLAADVRAVLDSLGLDRATLVAHSIAGGEASLLATTEPRRFRRVVYLDSIEFGCPEPPRPVEPEPGAPPLPPSYFVADPLREPLPPADTATAEAAHAAWVRTLGWSMPVDELRAQRASRASSTPPPVREVFRERERCIQGAPAHALNVFAQITSVRWDAFDAADRPVAVDSVQERWMTQGLLRRVRANHARFTQQFPGARTAFIPNAHHFVFLSHPDETFAAMRAFLAETGGR